MAAKITFLKAPATNLEIHQFNSKNKRLQQGSTFEGNRRRLKKQDSFCAAKDVYIMLSYLRTPIGRGSLAFSSLGTDGVGRGAGLWWADFSYE